MQQELKKATLKTLSAEEKAHKLDQLLSEEEAKIAATEKDISIAQEKQFKRSQELKDAKKQQQSKEAEIQVCTCTKFPSYMYIYVLCTCV